MILKSSVFEVAGETSYRANAEESKAGFRA